MTVENPYSAPIFLFRLTVAEGKDIGLYIMKKNDLKASLGQIRPREELISSTIKKVAEQKERQERRFFLPSYSFGMRLAGAVCALVFVFFMGMGIARLDANVAGGNDVNTPGARTLAELAVTEASTDGATMLSFEKEYENGYIIINGNVDSISFVELTDADKEYGAIRRCRVTVTANGLIEKSSNLNVDLNKASATFEADVVFCDNDLMDAFFDQSTGEMILRLTPDENGAWNVVEFAPLEK